MRTQLLCTFAHRKDLDLIVDYVQKSYTISEKRLFVFSNADKPSELYVTYNVEPDDYGKTPNTIMIHRKKESIVYRLFPINSKNFILYYPALCIWFYLQTLNKNKLHNSLSPKVSVDQYNKEINENSDNEEEELEKNKLNTILSLIDNI